jgi:hypothetical protein
MIKRPGMFRVSKVEDVNMIVFGFSCGVAENELENVNAFLEGFKEFVNDEFADDFSSTPNYGWDSLIRFNSPTDSMTMQLFAKLFTKFVSTVKDRYNLNI